MTTAGNNARPPLIVLTHHASGTNATTYAHDRDDWTDHVERRDRAVSPVAWSHLMEKATGEIIETFEKGRGFRRWKSC